MDEMVPLDDFDRLLAEHDAFVAALKAEGRPKYWKPKGSHRRNKPKRRDSDPWCHHYSREDVEYVDRYCAWDWCLNKICPTCNKIAWGMGPLACPCDHTNGWKSRYLDGQAKPHPPVKAVGRHGGRIQAGARKEKRRAAFAARWLS